MSDTLRQVKMVATDLDGTLLQPDKTVSPRSLKALDDARRAGLIVTIVTGRPPRWLAPVVHQTGWHGLAVAANGAVLLDLENQRIEQTAPISTADLVHAISTIRQRLPGVRFAAERAHAGSALSVVDPTTSRSDNDRIVEEVVVGSSDFGYEPGYLGGVLGLSPDAHQATIESLVAPGNVVKLLARAPDDVTEHPDDVAVELAERLIDCVTVTHSTTSGILLEMAASGVTKASGLAELAALHGVDPEHVIAVGDMPNDISMLEWAGRGFAVANAHPRVLATVGSFVTEANTDDGVAALIEQILQQA